MMRLVERLQPSPASELPQRTLTLGSMAFPTRSSYKLDVREIGLMGIMDRSDLRSMSIDDLWTLHEHVTSRSVKK